MKTQRLALTLAASTAFARASERHAEHLRLSGERGALETHPAAWR